MSNQLIYETSPYLRQHAHNPVQWYPWGETALRLSQEQDKPILLSIGYAACHWCHVMAHESFADAHTAEFMNRHFINIKVDREERPDLDTIYMTAVVALTGQGGWPMTIFLTPDGRPFYGGTYYPPTPRFHMPSFRQVLESVAHAWESRRAAVETSAHEIATHLRRNLGLIGQQDSIAGDLTSALLRRALDTLFHSFDPQQGGFGRAPKFPPAMTLEFLLLMAHSGDTTARHMAELTLQKMAYGGLYDQLGGGFARYATDNDWLVPHFEKMLYDNALLARVYLHAYQLTGHPLYRRIVTETLDFVARDMRSPSGGFYSSYDADSEGEEGKFYAWTAAEIQHRLGAAAPEFMAAYDVRPSGNWEGQNILHVTLSGEDVEARLAGNGTTLAHSRQILWAARQQRVSPGLDDKVLTAWNGLMLAAFAEAGRVLQRPDYTAVATQNATFLYQTLRQENGRLWRTCTEGTPAHYNAYLEDYAYLADGLLALYQTTFDNRWFTWASDLTDTMLTHFRDEAQGGFFDTAHDHETLLYRPKDVQDNATPSANAMAVRVLLQMSLYTGNGRFWDIATQTTAALGEAMTRYPNSFAHWLGNAIWLRQSPLEIAIAGLPRAADVQALLAVVWAEYRPLLVVAVGENDDTIPLLAYRSTRNGQATAYVCRQFVCQQPVTTPAQLADILSRPPG